MTEHERTTSEAPAEAYHSDAPIHDPAEDAFDRWPFAQRIAETIVTRSDPANLCIAIYGGWGEGKTTALSFIERRLKTHANVSVVHFNPWRFATAKDLYVGFFNALAAGIGGSLARGKERIAKAIAPYAKLLSPVSFGVFGVSLSPADLAKNIDEAASVDVERLKERLEDLIAETQKKIVVIVDDIDRMDREEVHATFKLIKACGDFRFTTYVLAFDDLVVAASLGKQYGEGTSAAGYDFLEKVVQVPLRLPAASEAALRRYCLGEVDRVLKLSGIQLSEDEVHAFVNGFDRGFSAAVNTPRMAKRYGNALAFALPLLRGEVNVIDLLLIEGIRVFFPGLYDFIKANPPLFLEAVGEGEDRQEVADRVKFGLSAVPEELRGGAKRIVLGLFPRLRAAFENFHYGPDYEEIWAKGQRVCSDRYYQRYFSYAIPKGDIADEDINSLCAAAEIGEPSSVNVQAERLLSGGANEAMINKIWQRVDSLSPSSASLLALALAPHGKLFPQTQGIMRFSLFSRSAGLINALLNRVPRSKVRYNVAKRVVETSFPVGFAAECFSWFRSGGETPEPERTLTLADEKKLGKVLAKRIKANATLQLIQEEQNIHRLLYIWSHYLSTAEPRAFVRKCVREDSSIAVIYLKSLVSMAYPLDGSPPHLGDFEGDSYAAVEKIVDVADIYRAVKARFGATLDGDDFNAARRPGAEERIAHQFAVLYRRRRSKTEDRSKSSGQTQAGSRTPNASPSE